MPAVGGGGKGMGMEMGMNFAIYLNTSIRIKYEFSCLMD